MKLKGSGNGSEKEPIEMERSQADPVQKNGERVVGGRRMGDRKSDVREAEREEEERKGNKTSGELPKQNRKQYFGVLVPLPR